MKWSILLILISSVLASFAQTFYKIGADISFFNFYILAGFILYCLTGLLIIIALKHVDMVVAFPLLSTSFIWVSLIAAFYFNEVLQWFNWIGIAFIAIGISFLGGAK